MTQENEPERLPTWATDGGSEINDPGPTKQAAGWINGEAPPAGMWNWQQNLVGQWVDYLSTISRPSLQTALQNLKRTATQPWNTSATYYKLQYLPGLGRFYMAQFVSAGNTTAWDSADGITWSGPTVVEAASAGCSQWVEKDGELYIAIDQKVFKSATGLVTDLVNVAATGTPDTATGMVWDSVNELFLISGQTAGFMRVVRATAGAFPAFSTSLNVAGTAEQLAFAPTTGVSVLGLSGAIGLYWSTDGVNYSSGVGTGGTSVGVAYNEGADAFVVAGGTLGDASNPSANWSTPSNFTEADLLGTMHTPEGIIYVMNYNATMRNVVASANTQMDEFQGGGVFAVSGADPSDPGNNNLIWLGNIQPRSAPSNDKMLTIDARSLVSMGNRTLVWPRNVYRLAYSKY